MPRRTSRAFAAILVAATSVPLSSCDFLLISTPCTLAVTILTSQTQVALRVGQSQTVSATPSTTCGERQAADVEVDVEWSSSDPAVARVDPKSKRITAVSPEETLILGEDRGPLHLEPVEVTVHVGR